MGDSLPIADNTDRNAKLLGDLVWIRAINVLRKPIISWLYECFCGLITCPRLLNAGLWILAVEDVVCGVDVLVLECDELLCV